MRPGPRAGADQRRRELALVGFRCISLNYFSVEESGAPKARGIAPG